MARSTIGSLWNPAQRNELDRMLKELYNNLGKATNTEQVLNDFLNGSGTVTSTMIGLSTIQQFNIGPHAVTGAKIAEKTITEPKYADGSLSTRVYQDGSVTNEKLAELPFEREVLTNNVTLSNVLENGRFLGLSSNVHSDLPVEVQGKSFILDVQTYSSNKLHVIQKVYQTRSPEVSYERFIQKGAFVGQWVKNKSLLPSEIQRSVLPEGMKLSSITKNGQYLGIGSNTHSDKPTGLNDSSFMLEVKTFNDNENFIIQTITSTGGASFVGIDNSYKRFIRSGGVEPIVGTWVKDKSLLPGGSSNTGHPLGGKTVVCFGDSLTEFGDYTGKISELTGANVINVGFGGCRMAKSPEGSNRFVYNEMSMVGISETLNSGNFTALENAAEVLKNDHNDDNTAAVSRFKNTDFNNVDYITIFYGTNDWNGEIPIGSADSVDAFDFNGAINKSVENILTKYPHIRILLLTPTWRARKDVGDGLETDNNPNPSGVYMIDYVEAIEERAKSHKIPSFNMYTQSGINIYTSEYYQRDGLHLTDKGDELMSRIISHELSGM